MESTLSDLWDGYWTWTGAHRGTVWLCSVALLFLYVIVENVGQPWMED